MAAQRATAREILAVLDACAEDFTFPMLDNGYVYLAATRLSLFASPADWAMVIEVFGFSPRAGLPDMTSYTFGSRVVREKGESDFVTSKAWRNYLAVHPHDEMRSAFPLEKGDWLDPESPELVRSGARSVHLRGRAVRLPARAAYAKHSIELTDASRVHTFELARFLAATDRDAVLATQAERRASVPPELESLLVLDEWHHPDLVKGQPPSATETFRQLARVLETGDLAHYRTSELANTHWRHWPDGGLL